MKPYPPLADTQRVAYLAPPTGPVSMVLDTDTYNEIDDQFAVVHALFSPERLRVRAIYAAPFHNERSTGPGDGMTKSHAEILRLLERIGQPSDGFVFPGATQWLPAADTPVDSPAARDLVAKALVQPEGQPLYVVAIGAITNVASAILLEPEIVRKLVVCWLGGHPTNWHITDEFNLRGDAQASRVILDSGVPLVLFPCLNMAEHLRTTLPEIERFVKGRGAIGDYLHEVYRTCANDHFGYSRVIWDLAPVAWLINPRMVETVVRPTPRLTTELTWHLDPHRHVMREAIRINRDQVFRDLFTKLEARR